MCAKAYILDVCVAQVLLLGYYTPWIFCTYALFLNAFCLLVTITHEISGLGAFIAGIMLGETEFQHQIEVEIRPFRDILLGLFFISIGMLLDVRTWPETWIWIALNNLLAII